MAELEALALALALALAWAARAWAIAELDDVEGVGEVGGESKR